MSRTRADRGDWDMHPSDAEDDNVTTSGDSVGDREAAQEAADDYEQDITRRWDP